ncbi:MAG: PQQ-binding-like beta-propeller repeat protein [bacterium]
MNRRQLALIAGALLLAVVTMALKCGDTAPTVPVVTPPTVPVYQNAEVPVKFVSEQAQDKNVKYVVDWGDGTTDTSAIDYPSGTEATLRHVWASPGSYEVKALAYVAEKPDLASDWSEPKTVTIGANSSPTGVMITYAPLNTARNRDTRFEAIAEDPEGDSVAYQFNYGGSLGSWTAFVPSGTPGEDFYKFRSLGEYYVKARARDHKGSMSGWSDSVMVKVDTTGVVVWAWLSPDEDEGEPLGSALVMMVGEEEIAYVGAADLYGKFFGVKIVDGKTRYRSSSTDEDYYSGHPAYVATTGNIIVGCEDGRLYAFSTSLSTRWKYPSSGDPDFIEWGVPAVNGNKIYCTRDDDMVHYLTDNGASANYGAGYSVRGIVDNPVIDNVGQVIVVTDSGRVLVLSDNLNTVVWDTLLNENGRRLSSPVIASGGIVLIGDIDGNVYALNSDRTLKWKAQVTGEANGIVVGSGAVYVATGAGRLYRLNPETGATVWNIALTGATEVETSPVLAANGMIYVHDDQDQVHCVKQEDGSYVWICQCEDYLSPARRPGRRGTRDFENSPYSPGLSSGGDIIVVGADALYCVAGYTEGTLALTAWPKWQGGMHNTGKAGSF